jgi:hypothetical protein
MAASASTAFAEPPQGAQKSSSATKLAQILDQSGYTFTKAADNVWVIPFKGKALTEFSVFITSVEDIVVIGAVVAEKKNMKVTPEMMQKLLRLTHNLDRVKIGFDDEEDLFVRVEVSARVLDTEEFKANTEQVAAAADEVFAAIKPFVTAAPK